MKGETAMALDSSVPRTRRAVLAASAAAVAATVAQALGRPSQALAGVDGDVVLGTSNSAATPTSISNMANGNTVFQASSSASGIGVGGFSNTWRGVAGESGSDVGVFGYSSTGTGVVGQADNTSFATKAKTGVYGKATLDANSRAIWGTAYAGRGVFGEATSGLGVRGFAQSGVGLSGEATTGYALRTTGRVRFDQSAGSATIAAGTSTKIVTPGVDLTSTSTVVATLNGDPGSAAAVKWVGINTTANTFTIYLTANAGVSVKVSWLVLG
jgi:hypothetical protein